MTAAPQDPARTSLVPVLPSELLERYPRLTPPVSTARAAVTIVLRSGSADIETLLIERTRNPNDPASGQVALPGGRVDETDGSLADTALRELEEEVGIPPGDVQDSLRYVRTAEARAFGMRVGVFAAELGPRSTAPSPRSAVEVAHVFWMPRHHLSEARTSTQVSSRGSFQVRSTLYEGHLVWGFTRRVLRDFFAFPDEDADVGPPFAAEPSRE